MDLKTKLRSLEKKKTSLNKQWQIVYMLVEVRLLNGKMRPDVLAVARVGNSKMIEIVSLSQTISSQQAKINLMLANNPNTIGKVIGWALQNWFLF